MPAPVTVLPVTLPDASGAAINVDLYIVGCRTRYAEHVQGVRRAAAQGLGHVAQKAIDKFATL